MFVYFAIYSTRHNAPNIIKYSIESNAFSVFVDFQTADENAFHGFGNLVIWL